MAFEDGLFTGVEVEGILGALLGKRQKQGIVPLRNADQLCNRLIQLCFAVSSDLGEYRLRYALKQLGLNKVSIIVGRRFRVAVLTAAGEQACKNDTLLTNDKNGKTIIAAPHACITPVVFSDPTLWGSKEKLSEALGVCKQLGLQLFSNYLSRQGKLERWSRERIDECALGGGYLGLAFGFSFSIPKATLPVFWCGGP